LRRLHGFLVGLIPLHNVGSPAKCEVVVALLVLVDVLETLGRRIHRDDLSELALVDVVDDELVILERLLLINERNEVYGLLQVLDLAESQLDLRVELLFGGICVTSRVIALVVQVLDLELELFDVSEGDALQAPEGLQHMHIVVWIDDCHPGLASQNFIHLFGIFCDEDVGLLKLRATPARILLVESVVEAENGKDKGALTLGRLVPHEPRLPLLTSAAIGIV
jgi:hypothetical protein